MRFPILTLATLALALVLGGCDRGPTVDPTKANALVKRIADEVGPVTAIECPDHVAAVSGATFECVAIFAGGNRQPAVVTLTSVEDGDVRGAATWKTPLLGARQRADVGASMAEKLGVKVTVQCLDEVLVLPVGERARCTARGGAGDVAVDVWFEPNGDLGWRMQ